MAAASTVSVTRMKIMGFAIAGAVAALGRGALYGTLQENLSPANTFAPQFSIDVVAISVIGGPRLDRRAIPGCPLGQGNPGALRPDGTPRVDPPRHLGHRAAAAVALPAGRTRAVPLQRARLPCWDMISRSRFGARASPPKPAPLPVTALAAPPETDHSRLAGLAAHPVAQRQLRGQQGGAGSGLRGAPRRTRRTHRHQRGGQVHPHERGQRVRAGFGHRRAARNVDVSDFKRPRTSSAAAWGAPSSRPASTPT